MPSSADQITPQPEPTSPPIKKLLSRALVKPESLTPAEVQQLAASVVCDLLTRKAPAPEPPAS